MGLFKFKLNAIKYSVPCAHSHISSAQSSRVTWRYLHWLAQTTDHFHHCRKFYWIVLFYTVVREGLSTSHVLRRDLTEWGKWVRDEWKGLRAIGHRNRKGPEARVYACVFYETTEAETRTWKKNPIAQDLVGIERAPAFILEGRRRPRGRKGSEQSTDMIYFT